MVTNSNIFNNYYSLYGVSEIGVPRNHPNSNGIFRIFPCKPVINGGTPHLWNPPIQEQKVDQHVKSPVRIDYNPAIASG